MTRPCDLRLVREPKRDSDDYLRRDLVDAAKGGIGMRLYVQFQVDPERTPVEDTSKIGEETDSPIVPAGKVVMPPQTVDPASTPACDQLSFSPWHSIPAHKPMGNINRARRFVYDASRQHRGGGNPARAEMSGPSKPPRVGALKRTVMTNAQSPLNTGFTSASTADDVLRGVDLRGKNAIVTGGHAGLGLETTRALVKAGASVTVASRDPERATRAVAGIERVEVSSLDLADPASISAFVTRWLATNRPLPILVNNATSTPSPQLLRDARGHELQFATGHLGHFQLTNGLLPALRAANGARVVNLSSGAQRFGEIRWDDPGFTTDYSPMAAYAQVKKANVLFTVELDRRFRAEKIRSYAVHPGVIIHKAPTTPERTASLRAQGLLDEAGTPVIDPERGKKTIAQGVSTIVFAAASPLLDPVGGVYLKDNDVSRIDDEVRPLSADSIPSEVSSSSIDPQAAERLWELSERLLLTTRN